MKIRISYCNLMFGLGATGISIAFGLAAESAVIGTGVALLFCLLKIYTWDMANADLGCKPVIWRELRREIAVWVIGALVGGLITWLVLFYKAGVTHE